MPFINTKFSGEMTEQQMDNLKAAYGSAMPVLGKSEQWLMVGFEQNVPLYFKGERSPKIAFVEVNLYGSAPDSAYSKLTGIICKALGDTLGVPSNCVYVKYSPTENWGWNGSNF